VAVGVLDFNAGLGAFCRSGVTDVLNRLDESVELTVLNWCDMLDWKLCVDVTVLDWCDLVCLGECVQVFLIIIYIFYIIVVQFVVCWGLDGLVEGRDLLVVDEVGLWGDVVVFVGICESSSNQQQHDVELHDDV